MVKWNDCKLLWIKASTKCNVPWLQVPCADRDPETWQARCYSVPQGSKRHCRPCSGHSGLPVVFLYIQRGAVQHQGLSTRTFLSPDQKQCWAVSSHHPFPSLVRWRFMMRCPVSTCSISWPLRPHLQESCPPWSWWPLCVRRPQPLCRWRILWPQSPASPRSVNALTSVPRLSTLCQGSPRWVLTASTCLTLTHWV